MKIPREHDADGAATVLLHDLRGRLGQASAVVEELLKHGARRIVKKVVTTLSYRISLQVEDRHVAADRHLKPDAELVGFSLQGT